MAEGTEDQVRFYEWDGLAEKWINKEEAFDLDFPSKFYDESKSIAAWIIEDVFDLNLISSSDIGSSLPGYDIKNRNAYDMIRLSLAAELKNEKLYECYANENGDIEFYEIGSNSADLDVLYKIESSNLSKQCDTVLISGYDPPPKRYAGEEFDLFTYANFIDFTDLPSYEHRYVYETYPKYYVWGDLFGPEQCDYYKEGYIVYGNPYFDNKNILVKQGVYDPKKFESVNGFIYKIHIPFFEAGHTQVEFSNTSPRIEELDSFGELQHRTLVDSTVYMPAVCREGDNPDPSKGIRLPNSNDVRFLGVKSVYIYGYKINHMYLDKFIEGGRRVDGAADVVAEIDTMLSEPFALSAGTDYLVVKDPSDPNFYKIIFSCAIDNDDVRKLFGGKIGVKDGNLKMRVSPSSIRLASNLDVYANFKAIIDDKNNVATGVLADGKTEVSSNTVYKVTVFPIGDGTSGYVVNKLLVVYNWDEPCIHITDSRNVVRKEKLEEVSIHFYPMITQDKPAPVATQDKILDPSEAIPDFDVTTVENLQSVEYNRVFSSLESGDIKLTLPFLDDAEDCMKVAKFIKDMQNKIVPNVTYVCSPLSEPHLGDEIDDDLVINSITYSYQDGSSYFINVQAGPIWQGMSGWETSLYKNQTEQVQLEGVVLNVHDDNTKCYVSLDKLGIMECINQTKSILHRGDRVSVTVYNNPRAV